MFVRPVVRRRPLLRAAAVGGTFAAGRAMGRRAQQRDDYYEPDQYAQPDQAAAQPPAQPAGQASGGSPPMLDQLAKLTTLHDQGALTDEEFTTAKAKILAGG
jgi:Short C-terminal domain